MYNPFVLAAQAAWSELSSEEAVYHYQKTAWAHAQRSVDDSIIVATYTIHGAIALYNLAVGLADAVAYTQSVMAVDDEPFEAEYPKYLPVNKAIAALPPAKVEVSLEDEFAATVEQLQRLSVKTLKTRCKNKGLKVSGNRPVLARRLAQAMMV